MEEPRLFEDRWLEPVFDDRGRLVRWEITRRHCVWDPFTAMIREIEDIEDPHGRI